MKKILQYVLAAVLGMTGCFSQTVQIMAKTISGSLQAKVEEENTVSKDTEVGDVIIFGEYEQDTDTANGKEPIEWIVLDKQDGKILLISKYCLDEKLYNDEQKEVPWDQCTLRKWLNSTFMDEAFNKEEQNRIVTTTVKAQKNPDYPTLFNNAGKDTEDKIFLLSIQEAKRYFNSDDDRGTYDTEYAIERSVSLYDSDGYDVWWLRSPGENSSRIAIVGICGQINTGGTVAFDSWGLTNGVRPALWIKVK